MADDDNGLAGDNSGIDPKARGRGRPRGSRAKAVGTGNGIDGSESGVSGIEGGEAQAAGSPETPGSPEAAKPEADFSGTAPPKKRRGRPPGSGTKTPGTKANAQPDLTVRELATEIAGAYWMVAQITQQPVFDIGLDRAAMIAKPLLDVQRHYPIKLDGPAISIAKLAGGILAVNLPIIAYLGAARMERRKQANAQRATQPATPEETIIPGATEARPAYDFSAAN